MIQPPVSDSEVPIHATSIHSRCYHHHHCFWKRTFFFCFSTPTTFFEDEKKRILVSAKRMHRANESCCFLLIRIVAADPLPFFVPPQPHPCTTTESQSGARSFCAPVFGAYLFNVKEFNQKMRECGSCVDQKRLKTVAPK